MRNLSLFAAMVLCAAVRVTPGQDSMFSLELSHQTPIREGATQYHRTTQPTKWVANKTAIIVCDVWDAHHSINAVRRLEEFVGRLDDVLAHARTAGATIIHSPSDCMPQYREHPARLRAQKARSGIQNLPKDVQLWCSKIPGEEAAFYPIDQSDGGEDDHPDEHEAWAKKLKSEGRNPNTPWLKQHPRITIHPQLDYLSDRGDEVWAILEQNQIEHVILTGVHTNMCVLGRPFGLRQMARVGKDVVLMRDMTDTMYNPARWPFVSHFTGTDLIIDHVERHVCPTMTSDQLLGGESFRFKDDKRPHVVFVIGEKLYETATTLSGFAAANLGQTCRVSFVHANAEDPNDFPGLGMVESADLVVLSVRRRTPPAQQLEMIRKHISFGKPIIGLRTSSHAFAARTGTPDSPLDDWPEFDSVVWGGNYHGHHPNEVKSEINVAPNQENHPWLKGVGPFPWPQSGSLYQSAPVAKGAEVLLYGKAKEFPAEPVAWTFQRSDGGRSFYTSLGHPQDFENPLFVCLLNQAVHGMLHLPPPDLSKTYQEHLKRRSWQPLSLPKPSSISDSKVLTPEIPTWYRCTFRLPKKLIDKEATELVVPDSIDAKAWLNGQELRSRIDTQNKRTIFSMNQTALEAEETSLLVIRLPSSESASVAPWFRLNESEGHLSGRWEMRQDGDSSLSRLPLPAKFGTVSDIYIEPELHYEKD